MAQLEAKRVKGGPSSSPAPSSPEREQFLLPDLPLEMIQHIMEMGGSLKLIKNCRLVSKSWNDISCTVLKKVSVVRIDDDEELLEQFKEFLLERQLNNFPDLPNPFENYDIDIGPIFPSDISNFIQYSNVRINVLTMKLDPSISARKFRPLLSSCKQFVKQLSIRNCCEGSNVLLYPELTQGWTSLTSLTFCDRGNSDVPADFMKFIQALVRENPLLHNLSLSGELENVKKCLVSKTNAALVNLRSLSIHVTELGDDPELNIDNLQQVSTIEAPNLHELSFHLEDGFQAVDDELKQTVLTIVERHSLSLKLLATNVLSLNEIPNMPELQSLTCSFDEDGTFEYVNEEDFPCLTNLTVIPGFTDIPEFVRAQGANTPHLLLNTLAVIYEDGFENAGTQAIWSILGHHFPLVTKISVSFRSECCEEFSLEIFQAIGKWFPQLESLEISSETEMSLFDLSDLVEFTEKGWALSDITVDPILCLKKLVSLKLKGEVTLHRNFIKFGLSQMKNWRSLTFPWDEVALRPADKTFQELQFPTNIPDIIITSDSYKTIQELSELAEETPNVSLEFTGERHSKRPTVHPTVRSTARSSSATNNVNICLCVLC